MIRKIRDIKRDLRRAGFLESGTGDGSHEGYRHPDVPGTFIASGHDGDDAGHYLEKQLQAWLRKAKEANDRR
jgi:predicted RNA binding protein YcfA (HicA-like mRNA interferase family)